MNSLLRNRCVALTRAFSTSVVKKCAVPPVPPKKPKFTSAITWKSMTATAIIGGGLTAFMMYVKREKQEALDRERKRQLGKAKIGGQFELVNTEVNLNATYNYHDCVLNRINTTKISYSIITSLQYHNHFSITTA